MFKDVGIIDVSVPDCKVATQDDFEEKCTEDAIESGNKILAKG